jgi:uncharacterized protein (DUF2147 family)
MRSSILFMALAIMLTSFHAAPKADPSADAILGKWLTGTGKAHVEIYKNGTKYFGKIIWLKEPIDPATGKPKVDVKNEDKRLQSRPLMGMMNLRDFEYAGGKVWEDGRIYNPEDGKDYACKMTLKNDNTLDVRGYVGISLIGKTQTWTRVK